MICTGTLHFSPVSVQYPVHTVLALLYSRCHLVLGLQVLLQTPEGAEQSKQLKQQGGKQRHPGWNINSQTIPMIVLTCTLCTARPGRERTATPKMQVLNPCIQ
jgi:hypothetical protein